MTIEQLCEAVDAVWKAQDDDEAAHGMEDDLMRSWIRANASPDELKVFEYLWSLGFSRWCA